MASSAAVRNMFSGFSRFTLLLAVYGSLLMYHHCMVPAQSITAINGSIVWSVPGASMVFKGSEEINANTNLSTLMFSQADVANQIAIAVLQTRDAAQLTTNAAQLTTNNAINSRMEGLQISNAGLQMTITGLQAANTNLTAALTAERDRAIAIETSLTIANAVERERAIAVETNLTKANAAERERAIAVETSMSFLFQETIARMNQSFQYTVGQIYTKLGIMTACANAGLLADANGLCIPRNTSSSSSGSGSDGVVGSCTVGMNSLIGTAATAKCFPGFSPVSSSTASCSGSASATNSPTTFGCVAVPCPSNSTGINVPSGCTCVAGLSGVVVASTIPPSYLESSCAHNSCPANSSGANVFSGCICLAGFSGAVVATFDAPNFYNSTCKAVPCPNNSAGMSIGSGCTCNSPYVGSVVASLIGPAFFTGGCVLFPAKNQVRFLIVAGGGGGGSRWAGGGGGGGFLTGFGDQFASYNGGVSYAVTVGSGGIGAAGTVNGVTLGNNVPGQTGADSAFNGITAKGGGGGGGYGNNDASSLPTTGGSGGGGGLHVSGTCQYSAPGIPGQGFAGGQSTCGLAEGGGGGGAGGVGFSASSLKGGDGGPGKLSNISGNDLYWAAGGGGCLNNGCQTCQGVGGIGGGGSGCNNADTRAGPQGTGVTGGLNPGSVCTGPSQSQSTVAGSGGLNTGSGGGGSAGGSANGYFSAGGNGGSGIVILSYPATFRAAIVTGTVTTKTVAGQQIYIFLTSGTIIF